MAEGFIKLSRKIEEWGWFNEDYMLRLWIHILLHCNYRERNERGVLVQRGQCLTTVSEIAKNLDLSASQVRTGLKRLNLTNEIAIETTNKNTLITVINWDLYQHGYSSVTSDLASTLTNESQTNRKQIANPIYKEEYKEGKKDKKIYYDPSINPNFDEERFTDIIERRKS